MRRKGAFCVPIARTFLAPRACAFSRLAMAVGDLLRAPATCGETPCQPARPPPSASMGTGKGWTEIESVWAFKAFVRASENPIVANGKTTKDFAMRIKRSWSDIISELLLELLVLCIDNGVACNTHC
jgi:hypothetical protein